MNGKYLGVVIGAVVAIMLVGSLLMPIINDTTTETETITPEGAYWPMKYQTDTDVNSYYYFKPSYNTETSTIDFKDGPLGNFVTEKSVSIDDLTGKTIIVYADNNVTIYIENNKYNFDFHDGFTVTPADLNNSPYVYRNGSGAYKYGTGLSGRDAPSPIEYYYTTADEDGSYANFVGDNPPSMDTPAVSVDGVYIGLKVIEITTSSPGAPIYLAIPIVILVSLLVAVAAVAFRRDY